ncbi:hypothetical protein CIB48_g3025 [Xylaria polymorpha]|nr:hypothetical protein CIB48_g3025 [Xylaria polymorpha]
MLMGWSGIRKLGRAVVRELVDAGFAVTIFTRENSTSALPAGVVAKEVDYTSVETLRLALQGEDAVVSTIATVAVGGQRPLVDAAVAAGVKRIIPSEFGINTRFLGKEPIGNILQGKVQTLNYIHEKSKQSPSFTWTGISTGLFFDWGLEHGSIGLDKDAKIATIYDSGNEPYQASNLSHIGKVIAAVLNHPEQTINRYISVASFNPTQNQVLEIVERLTEEKWTRVYGDGAGLAVEGPDNALDILELEGEDLEATLQTWLGLSPV